MSALKREAKDAAILIRVPAKVKEALETAAVKGRRSLSEHCRAILEDSLPITYKVVVVCPNCNTPLQRAGTEDVCPKCIRKTMELLKPIVKYKV